MPNMTEGKKSPVQYQRKSPSFFATPVKVHPITKRPIDKITTRSQTQYHQLIGKSPSVAFLDDKDKNDYNQKSLLVKALDSNLPSTIRSSQSNDKSEPTTRKLEPPSQIRRHSSPLNSHCYLPLFPQEILEHTFYTVRLTSYEKKEIVNYPHIFFLGKRGIKKRTPITPTICETSHGVRSTVYGFDDTNGSYMPIMNDHVQYRYEVLGIIGKGTFGVVVEAYDHRDQINVALKIIRNQERFHKQAKEEIRILSKLNANDVDDKFNVIHMYDNFVFRNHTCIVFELLSLNLFELTKLSGFNGFTISLIRRFAHAILRCLYELTKFDIIHCDLKPENILLKQRRRSSIKVIDFGSSCFSDKRVHTYIQSRYYRSPEVILCGKYGPQIDMWSLGCILAELYTGRPLLNGDNEGDQLACMIELLGLPPTTFLNKCKTNKVRNFFDDDKHPLYCARYFNGKYQACEVRSPKGKIRGSPASRELLSRCDDEDFKHFIRQCLIWDPAERITPADAFRHPWISQHRGVVSHQRPNGGVYQLDTTDLDTN